MITKSAFDEVISKCSRYISQISYTRGNQELHQSVINELPFYITTYCSNITSLDLTASTIEPWGLVVLAEKCKKIKKLSIKLSLLHKYEEELTNLFEVNEELEDIALYELQSVCPSLKQLPEHKMKAITLACFEFGNDIFSSVSII